MIYSVFWKDHLHAARKTDQMGGGDTTVGVEFTECDDYWGTDGGQRGIKGRQLVLGSQADDGLSLRRRPVRCRGNRGY